MKLYSEQDVRKAVRNGHVKRDALKPLPPKTTPPVDHNQQLLSALATLTSAVTAQPKDSDSIKTHALLGDLIEAVERMTKAAAKPSPKPKPKKYTFTIHRDRDGQMESISAVQQ